MPFFLVRYTYTGDTAGRDEHRPEHKNYLTAAADRGLILGSGPFAAAEEPGAAMIYEAAGKQEVAEIVDGDPFYSRGYVASYEITEWIPMIGPWALAAAGGRP